MESTKERFRPSPIVIDPPLDDIVRSLREQRYHDNRHLESVISSSQNTPLLVSTAPQELLEHAVTNLYAALKLAEATLKESSRLLEETPMTENIALVVTAQKEVVARMEEMRAAMKVDFKHAGAQDLLKGGMNDEYQEAKR